ncbi:hypothetical protein A2U94_17465 [Bacillus sp. VT 712]|uniref:Uncharacterized protein n=1 Tax=Priestia veravalensis TaxID=1414648 RepID=A0A0V8JI89_9BACI|nr:hypothetical protein AS180_16670 [Priestia veravalensis]KZB90191.1 hypothetical protein A2U94_17465 [Bacillus sp. VT 712]
MVHNEMISKPTKNTSSLLTITSFSQKIKSKNLIRFLMKIFSYLLLIKSISDNNDEKPTHLLRLKSWNAGFLLLKIHF